MKVFHAVAEIPDGFGPERRHDRQVRRRPHRPPRGDRPAARRRGRARARRRRSSRSTAIRSSCSRPTSARPRSSATRRSSSCSPRPGSTRRSCWRSTARSPSLAPEEFVHRILVDRLHAAAVLVGSDFRFGARGRRRCRAAARSWARRYGFTVELHRRRAARARAPRLVDLDPRAARRRRRRPRDRAARFASHRPRRRRARRGARARAGVPDREPVAGVGGAHPRRRRVRRLADRRRRAVPGRDLGRQQPDLRGRAAQAGRGLRARPRARPLRPHRRGLVRASASAAWSRTPASSR